MVSFWIFDLIANVCFVLVHLWFVYVFGHPGPGMDRFRIVKIHRIIDLNGNL